ncbi:MAG: 1,4-dihydroxy-2-naphthoate polyprenyltransferase [Rhodocyclaceae bacterium]|nr:1,4-dihydroxy-2-naphthoate polyprenyltransferase [Rhodocyclaceae bacterium]
MPPSPWRAWFLALRPRTLPVSLSPVLVGSAAAWHDRGQVLWLPLLAAIVAAGLIQVGTNLFNDVGDFLRGTDTPDRLGPPRATAQGWLTPAQVRAGAWGAFGLAFLCGIYLAAHGGWPIVAIGLASLAAGWAYTGGPAPIAYRPLGEVFVWIFFGLVAVGGSYYLQTFSLSATVLLAAALVGLHAAAVITVNNYRDLDGDARSGKRTLAVLLGRPATRRVYGIEMLLPYLLLPALVPALGWPAFLPAASLPLAASLLQRFRREPPGPVFNQILAATARLQLVFALLLAAALMAPSLT